MKVVRQANHQTQRVDIHSSFIILFVICRRSHRTTRADRFGSDRLLVIWISSAALRPQSHAE